MDEKKKIPTFIVNLLAVGIALLIMGAFWYFTKTPQYDVIVGIFNCVAFGGLILALRDIMDKVCGDRKLITLQYIGGMLLVFAGIGVFVWALKFTGELDFWLRIVGAVFLGCLGCVWFRYKYTKSLQGDEEKESERWARSRRKIAKAKTIENATQALNKTLRFRLSGDSIDGSIDLDRPLALKNDKPCTYEDLLKSKEEGVGQIREDAFNYIQKLVGQLDIPVEPIAVDLGV